MSCYQWAKHHYDQVSGFALGIPGSLDNMINATRIIAAAKGYDKGASGAYTDQARRLAFFIGECDAKGWLD